MFTHAGWWKNLVGGARARMQIRGRKRTGTAIPIPENREGKIAGLSSLLTAVPSDARFDNVSLDQEGRPNQADLEQAVESATMIEVSLDQTV
jgi:hypothetical protein